MKYDLFCGPSLGCDPRGQVIARHTLADGAYTSHLLPSRDVAIALKACHFTNC